MKRPALAMLLLLVPALVAAQPAGSLQRIRDSKSIDVAYRTDAVPFSFQDAAGQPTGYTVDLCRRVIASIERQLGVPGLKVNWVPATIQNRFDLVAKGQALMECGASTATLSRMELVDFSNATFVDSTGVVVRNEAGVKSFAELAGKKIAVIAGSTNERALNSALNARGVSATVVPVKSRDEGIDALEKGTVEAFANDKILLVGVSLKVRDAMRYTMLDDDLSIEPYAIVLPRNDSGLRLAVNRGLAEVYRTKQIVEVFRRWFSGHANPTVLLQAVYFLGAVPE